MHALCSVLKSWSDGSHVGTLPAMLDAEGGNGTGLGLRAEQAARVAEAVPQAAEGHPPKVGLHTRFPYYTITSEAVLPRAIEASSLPLGEALAPASGRLGLSSLCTMCLSCRLRNGHNHALCCLLNAPTLCCLLMERTRIRFNAQLSAPVAFALANTITNPA
jgi:hypothetical protein